jgi:lysophospholipase L1-like esterase
MQKVLPNDKQLLVINIPDFSVTPRGGDYARGRDISAGLAEFNRIIAEETARRGLTMVDIFHTSRQMGDRPELVAADGLHPSATAYAEWEALIYPVASRVLGVAT